MNGQLAADRRALIESCARVLHETESTLPWALVPDLTKTTKLESVAALLVYLDEVYPSLSEGARHAGNETL